MAKAAGTHHALEGLTIPIWGRLLTRGAKA